MPVLEQEIARIDQQIAELQIVRRHLTNLVNGAVKPVRRRGPRAKGTMTTAQAAEKVLARAAGPMRTADLLKAVQAEGAIIRDGEGLSKTLGRSDRFKKAGRGLWTLTG